MVKKISEYGGMEKYSSKKAMGRHEGKESSRAEAGEKSMAMKKRGGGMATRGMGVALKKGGKVMKKAMGGDISSPIGRVGMVKPRFSAPPSGELTNKIPKFGGKPMPSNPMDRGAVSRMKKAMGGDVNPNTRNPPALGKLPVGGGKIISPIGRPGIGIRKPLLLGYKNGIDNQGRGIYDAAPPKITRLKKGGMAKGRKGCK